MRSQVNSRHAIVASLLIMSLAGCGKPSYDLTGKYKAGDILRDELHFSMPAGRLIAKAKGGAVEGKASFDGHTVREVTVLAIDRKGQPTKFKVSHLVDQFTMRLEAPGDKPEETTESGMLQGESIIFEMVAGEWNKTLFGKQPTPEQAKELQDCDNPLEEDLIPKGPVKLGSSWMGPGLGLAEVHRVGTPQPPRQHVRRVQRCRGARWAAMRPNSWRLGR